MSTPFSWLNTDSRQFLERDYLEPGFTPEQRVRQIAENAERLLCHMFYKNKTNWISTAPAPFHGFADKFYDYMSRGFYSLSTPVWINFGNNRGLPVSCVSEDTWINTRFGGKQAKDIQISDEVLTHRGRYRKVTAVIPTKEKDDIYLLKVNSRLTPLKITGNHLVKTNLGWVRVDKLNPEIHLVAVNSKIEVLPEQEYAINLFNYAYGTYEIDSKDALIKKKVSLKTERKTGSSYSKYHSEPFALVSVDEDIMWALGLWFAEGSLQTRKGKPSGIRITLDVSEEDAAKRFVNIFKEKFHLDGNVSVSEVQRAARTHRWINANINSNIIGSFFESFGDGCKEKLLPDWIFSLADNLKRSFLDGLLYGDGSIRPNNSIRLTLANPKLILQIYQLGLELGKEMSLQMQEKAGKLSSTRYVYTISFRNYSNKRSRNNCQAGIKFEDGLVYCPIVSLEKTNLVENVYDFTVDEDHSFSASGVVLHNCFGSYIDDSIEDILGKVAEVGTMTKQGGGCSGYFGALRNRGALIKNGLNGHTGGPVHFMGLFDNATNIISQGSARRGYFAAYLPIESPDVEEFLRIRSEGNPIQDISIAVTITDDWMKSMIDGDVVKRELWKKVIQKRFETGFPYLMFIDTVNNNAPQVYKDKGMKIYASNMCAEICLPSSKEESFVCVLSSYNLAKWDELVKTDAIETLIYFLDAVNEEFVQKTEKIKFMEAAHQFAKNHRALGAGALGWCSYLQTNSIPFESLEAKMLNNKIWSTIRKRADEASEQLALHLGEPLLLKNYGRRNTTCLALAPTTSSSKILGVSMQTEIWNSNYFTQRLAKGSYTFKNPQLIARLAELGFDEDYVIKHKDGKEENLWDSILNHGGSILHLDILSNHDKAVFKTFGEASQKEIVIQAIQRQKYIDQAQSLNLMIHPKTSPKEVNQLLIYGWQEGIKTFYYHRGYSPTQELYRELGNKVTSFECVSCSA